MVDALSGHTSAKNTLGADGLRDGDALSSPTLTNVLQGLRGNGIIRLQDGLYASTRNAVDSQPGAIARVSATPSFKLIVSGGYAVLDGQLYEFAGGAGSSATVTLSDHGGTALTSGDQSLYVVYVASKGGTDRVYAVGGTPTAIAQGVYPSLPSDYLSDYDGGSGATNEQVVVLGTVRCAYSSGGTGNNHNVDIIEINDKRHFLRPNPVYMLPITSGNVENDNNNIPSQVVRTGNTGVHTAAQLRGLLAGSEAGDFGTTANTSTSLINAGALWMSTSRTGANQGYGASQGSDRANQSMKDELFFAAQENSGTAVVSKRLFSKGVEAPSANIGVTASYTISSHGDQFFIGHVNDGITVTLEPEKSNGKYLFPEGHTIEVYNTATNLGSDGTTNDGKFIFDSAGVNASIPATHGGSGTRRKFVFDGSAWIAMPYSTGGVSSWLSLDDVDPSSYSGQAGKGVRVNSGATGLEFYTPLTALAGIEDLSSSNDDQLTIKDTEIVINEDSDASVDFRAESNNQTHMLFVDSSTDHVGVQQSTPLAPLQVKGSGHDYATKVATSFDTSTATTIELFSIHEFRACEVLVEVHNITDNIYEVAKAVITHPYTKLVFEADSQAGGNPTNKVLTNVHDSSGASAFNSINVLRAGMKLSGTQINGAASIASVDLSSTPKTVTMSHAADAAAAGLAITAQHEPANDTAVPLTVYSVTQSDSDTTTTGTAQAAYSATVHTNKILLNLKATTDSDNDKMAIRVTWKALTMDMDELDWS